MDSVGMTVNKKKSIQFVYISSSHKKHHLRVLYKISSNLKKPEDCVKQHIGKSGEERLIFNRKKPPSEPG